MNGEPIPVLHGGPLRLIVPGWFGNHWMKWVRTITVAAEEAPGFYMQTGYRIPRTPRPPDAMIDPSDLIPVTAMNVKSLITWPNSSSRLKHRRERNPWIRLDGRGARHSRRGESRRSRRGLARRHDSRRAETLGLASLVVHLQEGQARSADRSGTQPPIARERSSPSRPPGTARVTSGTASTRFIVRSHEHSTQHRGPGTARDRRSRRLRPPNPRPKTIADERAVAAASASTDGPRKLRDLPFRRPDHQPASDAQTVEGRGREDGRLGYLPSPDQRTAVIELL